MKIKIFSFLLLFSILATAQSPQFKLTSGTLLVTPQAGGLEYNGINFFTTNGSASRTQIIATSSAGTSGTVLISQGAGVTPIWGTVSGGGTSQIKYQVFNANGTFTAPAGTTTSTVYKITIVGGGGGGGATGSDWCGCTSNSVYASGGGSGATAIYYGTGIAAAATVAVTVGAGGGSNGNNGSLSRAVFNGVTITANGGVGAGGGSATATNGHINISGGLGNPTAGSACNLYSIAGRSASIFGEGGPGYGGASNEAGQAGIVIFEWLQ